MPSSLDIMRRMRPQPPISPVAPAPGTDLGGGQTHIGMLDDDPFYGGSAASQVKRDNYFDEAEQSRILSGLTGRANFARGQEMQNQRDDDYDLEYRAPQRANLMGNVADIASERGAGREFLPQASRLYDRDRAAAESDVYNRYLAPAEERYRATIGAANLRRRGQVEAANITASTNANARQSSAMINGLMNAAAAQIDKGKPVDPAQLEIIRRFFAQGGGGQ